MESSDDISSDSVPNTPKSIGSGKFSFPLIRNSVGRLSSGHTTSPTVAVPTLKNSLSCPVNDEASKKNDDPAPAPSATQEKSNKIKPKTEGKVVYR